MTNKIERAQDMLLRATARRRLATDRAANACAALSDAEAAETRARTRLRDAYAAEPQICRACGGTEGVKLLPCTDGKSMLVVCEKCIAESQADGERHSQPVKQVRDGPGTVIFKGGQHDVVCCKGKHFRRHHEDGLMEPIHGTGGTCDTWVGGCPADQARKGAAA